MASRVGQQGFAPEEILLKSNSRVFAQALEKALNIAKADTTVLLTGESGVGKEVFARYLHKNSSRSSGPFIAVSCPALTETLLESELFGHERGAFTGAVRLKRGKFELAHNGTLFLDEIADMSLAAQAKLLRAIEYKEFERVGGERPVKVDVRVTTATNANLQKLISDGRFRQDLYYRINEVSIYIPSLRERKEDIELLAAHLLGIFNRQCGRKILKISDAAMKVLLHYHWPGNIRELRSVIRRAVALADSSKNMLWVEDLGINVNFLAPQASADEHDLSLTGMEKKHIERVLRQAGFNKKKTSELLRISRPTLDRKIKEYSIEV